MGLILQSAVTYLQVSRQRGDLLYDYLDREWDFINGFSHKQERGGRFVVVFRCVIN